MQTLTFLEVQNNFVRVTDLVSAGHGVRVTKDGCPAFLIIPESNDSDEILRRVAGRRLSGLLKGGEAIPAAKALSPGDVCKLINSCFP